jgi:hypothetical protein
MAERIVTAKIDARAKTVTLVGEAGLTKPCTFDVKVGDTLKWRLQGLPDGSMARVRFLTPGAPLLKRGNPVEANGAVIEGGAVNAGAAESDYPYVVELVTATGAVTKLECLWKDGSTLKDGLAPGRKSGGG